MRPWAAARGLAVAALLLAGACAGPLRVAVGPQPGADAPPVPLLWVAERGGRSLYLLGSFHLLSPRDYPLSPDVQAAFDDAEEVLLELSPEEMASPTLAARMARAARRDDGTTLGLELPPETRRKLVAWLRANAPRLGRNGLTAQRLQQFEPWFVALAVTMVGMDDAGLDPELGLDRHFADAAVAAGKRTGGLETGDQQIAFLDGMDRAEQVQMLDEALDDAAPGNDEIQVLHALWRAGEADAIWKRLGGRMQREYPGLYRRINVERNTAWLAELRRRLDAPGGDDTLVVVGSLHLLGPDGLVARLRDAGYRVRRICTACAPGVARSGGGRDQHDAIHRARGDAQLAAGA